MSCTLIPVCIESMDHIAILSIKNCMKEQILMFYHLKTRRCVKTVYMVSKLKHF